MKEIMNLEISSWTVVKIMLIIILFYLLFLIKDIIALFFIVLILTASFRPVVNKWEKKIGRHLSVLALILIALSILALFVYLLVPLILEQSKQLIETIPDLLNKHEFLQKYVPNVQGGLDAFTKNAGDITGKFVSLTAGIFGGVITFLMAIVLTVYLLLDKKGVVSVISFLVPSEQQEAVTATARKISQKVGNWFRGQIVLGLIIGVIDLIGLLIIGVPYALVLAIISGILEIVPTIGPIIAGLLAVLIALTASPIKALLVIALYLIVQQLENSIIVPKVMQKAVGLSPVIIILAILIGAKLFGVVGAILAVPLAGSIFVLIQEWPALKATFKKNA